MAKDTEETVYAPGGAEELEATRFEGGDSTPGTDTEPGVTTDRVRRRADPSVEATLFAAPGEEPKPTARPAAPAPPRSAGGAAPVDRTSFAQESLRLGVAFAHHFARHTLGVRAHLRVRLSDPGVSTDGGHKARQSILLVADTRARGTTVIGWLDTARQAAGLKTWELVAAQHEQRFRSPPDLGRDDYQALTADLQSFLDTNAITLEVDEPAPGATSSSGQSRRVEWSITPRHIVLFVALVLALGAVLGASITRSCDADEAAPATGLRNPLERFKR